MKTYNILHISQKTLKGIANAKALAEACLADFSLNLGARKQEMTISYSNQFKKITSIKEISAFLLFNMQASNIARKYVSFVFLIVYEQVLLPGVQFQIPV